MKFNFKKITSVLASVVMLGSTIGIAAAATNYPSPFVKGGVADVTVVFGAASPANVDFVAATDIGTSLSTALSSQTTAVSSTTIPTTSGGDSLTIEKSSDRLNMNNALNEIWTTKITSSNLPNLLKDETFRSKDNIEYGYEQYIQFIDALNFSQFDDDDYKKDTPTLGIKIPSSTNVINYTIDFKKYPRSDVDSSGMLEDIQDRDIIILGKTYKLLNAYNKSSATKFELMRGSTTDSINLNEEKTEKVDAKSYTITLTFVDATYSQFKVVDSAGNTQTTTKLAKGGTYKLVDGTQLGVTDISYQAFSGGVMAAEFTLGANKLTIEDGQALKIDDTTESGINCWIQRSEVDANKVDITKFGLTWKTDTESFVAKDSAATIPGFKSLKFVYGGFITPCEEKTTVKAQSTYGIQLVVPIKDGDATIPILYGNAINFTTVGGDNGEKILRTSNDTVGNLIAFDKDVDEYFVVSWNDSSSAESYLLTVTSFTEDTSISKNYTTIKNVVTGAEYKDKKADDIITMGKIELTIKQIIKEDKIVSMQLGGDSTFDRIYTTGGLGIWLPKNATLDDVKMARDGGEPGIIFNNSARETEEWTLMMSEEDKDGNLGAGRVINVTLGHSSNEAEPTEVEPSLGSDYWSASAYKEVGSSTNVYEGYIWSDLGTKVKITKPTSGQNNVEITYYCGQSYGQILLTAPETVVSGGNVTTEIGSVTKKDTELTATDKAKNLVVVGGSCINTVAAKLLGSDTPICTADFTTKTSTSTKTGIGKDQFLVEVFNNPYASGKVAMLVAGWEAVDTKGAVAHVTKESPITDVGTRIAKSTTTLTDVV